MPTVPLVRVYLFTYRRPVLLRRALQSLRAQTCTDWICELHNDDPADFGPAELLRENPDARIVLRHHAVNGGPIAAFNHAFRGGEEPFAALLEDDNWWEPAFLATMVAALQGSAESVVAWANMRLWQEEADGRWSDTGQNIWPRVAPGLIQAFRWPALLQGFETLLSNGAMVYRADRLQSCVVPATTPFVIMEAVRERAMPGPLLFVSTPLANYALTRATARGADRAEWAQVQMLHSASFFQQVDLSPAAARLLWNQRGSARPRSTGLLFLLTLAGVFPLGYLRHASADDWLHFVANFLRHPITQIRALRFRAAHPAVWRYLVEQTRLRCAERVPADRIRLEASSLLDKKDFGA